MKKTAIFIIVLILILVIGAIFIFPNKNKQSQDKMTKIKLSDYVMKFISKIGVKHVFLISGGGNIHLVDSLGKNKNLNYLNRHSELVSESFQLKDAEMNSA